MDHPSSKLSVHLISNEPSWTKLLQSLFAQKIHHQPSVPAKVCRYDEDNGRQKSQRQSSTNKNEEKSVLHRNLSQQNSREEALGQVIVNNQDEKTTSSIGARESIKSGQVDMHSTNDGKVGLQNLYVEKFESHSTQADKVDLQSTDPMFDTVGNHIYKGSSNKVIIDDDETELTVTNEKLKMSDDKGKEVSISKNIRKAVVKQTFRPAYYISQNHIFYFILTNQVRLEIHNQVNMTRKCLNHRSHTI